MPTSWARVTHVPHTMLNEWFTLCILETHERQWIMTEEEMRATSLKIEHKSISVDCRLLAAQQRMNNALNGMEEYATLMDDCDMKFRQLTTTMRECQFLAEKTPTLKS